MFLCQQSLLHHLVSHKDIAYEAALCPIDVAVAVSLSPVAGGLMIMIIRVLLACLAIMAPHICSTEPWLSHLCIGGLLVPRC